MEYLRQILNQAPELALFLSLAIGYWVGSIQFGKFQLGGVAGSLLVAVVISQVGISIDNGIKSVLFALFIYAVGFESGPQFFRSLGRQSLREIVLAAVMALSGLLTIIACARLFGLDKGIAAGIAAGSMTQSAIIGTASAAIAKLDLPLEQIQALQGNVAVGYAVTYIFGSFGAIILCVNVLPWFMRRSIRDDATQAEAELLAGAKVYGPGELPAIPPLVGRLYRIDQAAGQTVAQLEVSDQGDPQAALTIERIKRGGALVGVTPTTVLEAGDVVLVVGRRAGVVAIAGCLGAELQSSPDMDVVVVQRDVSLDNPTFVGRRVAEIRQAASQALRHGVYVVGVKRAGRPLALEPDTVIEAGDLVTLYGTPDDIQRVAQQVGSIIVPSDKTDFVFHGFGLAVGLLIGLVVIRLGAIPLTLGSGGGALIAGLVFGWYRSRHLTRGNLPLPASTLLRDLGLAGFVAVVGLQSGRQAVETIATQGLSIFLIGVVVCVVPIVITILVGRYVLRYRNLALFAGAVAGARSANPAFGEVLDKAGNSIPTVPFAVTYALANVFLTLLGPLVVAFA
ncbi:YidE/YbjL duplication [Pseudomonas psychrotolerans L19]|uniref:aspartate-alanine antiporter n=1 Tax=Pseudomonas TaxID=286 RepID=UPI00023A1BF3|nr:MULTISPECIES: aspartate-alanine antiporter [Pseudomonas]EHK72239.1 YidE/YbjL duplication [Pseudomonas psychrotolerans L19]MBA1179477.1 aspartate-alanine antiporter [Pseudomonas psychrotolerans]MBA1210309.1 aspartate-alanine antiporter [Pseudomonas psychrotolerans]TCQ91045.1 aspartate-alanine antiporter [Pseudomonas sp. JUb52]